jgi:hypothetical protein
LRKPTRRMVDPSRGSLMVVGLTLMNQWLVGKAEREVCLPSCGAVRLCCG